MALEIELAVFNQMKEQLLGAYEGKFVLIHQNQFVGAFDSAENAYNEGVSAFGQDPFLVKKVTRSEPVFTNHALSYGLIHARF